MAIYAYLYVQLHLVMGVNLYRRYEEWFILARPRILRVTWQECGRAGRDGEPSSLCPCLHGLLLGRLVKKSMKVYVQARVGRRKILMDNFGYQ